MRARRFIRRRGAGREVAADLRAAEVGRVIRSAELTAEALTRRCDAVGVKRGGLGIIRPTFQTAAARMRRRRTGGLFAFGESAATPITSPAPTRPALGPWHAP